MNELTLKLLLLIIPGIIASIVYNRLTAHKKWTNFENSIHILLFGVFSYLFLQLVLNSYNFLQVFFNCNKSLEFSVLKIWNSLSDSRSIPYNEIIFASLLSIILGFFGSYFDKFKIINRIGRYFKVSNKYGDENLFSFFLNAKDIHYVYVRQIKNNLTYHGYVESYSEDDDLSELVLSDVKVYSYLDSEFLYEIDRIYISLNKNEIIIEQAKLTVK